VLAGIGLTAQDVSRAVVETVARLDHVNVRDDAQRVEADSDES
jgi:hypothetical protein